MNTKVENPKSPEMQVENASGTALTNYVEEWMSGSRKINKKSQKFLALCVNDKDLNRLLEKGILRI